MSERKRGYRYRITASAGSLEGQDGSHWIDWTYFGRGHTWTVYDFVAGEETGWARGVYVDKGWMVDHKYVTDAELTATTSDRAQAVAPESPSGG